MRAAVVGHVEWIELVRVPHVPAAGEIVPADDTLEAAAGGGGVAAVQLARLAGECLLVTALGDDELGRRAKADLERRGVRVEAAWRTEPQRRAFVQVDAEGERTITVIGDRMGARGEDRLPWDELAEFDAVYVSAGDADAVRAARAAATLVATVRAGEPLKRAGVELDALVASSRDSGERYSAGDLDPEPRMVVLTAGAEGGTILRPGGGRTEWDAAPLPGPAIDTYGSGDSFAAGLTYGLGEGRSAAEAVALGAHCGAAAITGRGPYEAQLADPG